MDLDAGQEPQGSTDEEQAVEPKPTVTILYDEWSRIVEYVVHATQYTYHSSPAGS